MKVPTNDWLPLVKAGMRSWLLKPRVLVVDIVGVVAPSPTGLSCQGVPVLGGNEVVSRLLAKGIVSAVLRSDLSELVSAQSLVGVAAAVRPMVRKGPDVVVGSGSATIADVSTRPFRGRERVA